MGLRTLEEPKKKVIGLQAEVNVHLWQLVFLERREDLGSIYCSGKSCVFERTEKTRAYSEDFSDLAVVHLIP